MKCAQHCWSLWPSSHLPCGAHHGCRYPRCGWKGLAGPKPSEVPANRVWGPRNTRERILLQNHLPEPPLPKALFATKAVREGGARQPLHKRPFFPFTEGRLTSPGHPPLGADSLQGGKQKPFQIPGACAEIRNFSKAWVNDPPVGQMGSHSSLSTKLSHLIKLSSDMTKVILMWDSCVSRKGLSDRGSTNCLSPPALYSLR